MSNIKVSLRKALAPGRSEYNETKLMTVTLVTAAGEQYRHNLIGNRTKMSKLLTARYSVGDKLIVSDGEVIGKSKAAENTFYV